MNTQPFSLRKLGMMVAIAVPLALSLGVVDAPSSALADSPQSQCEGIYENDRGTKTCTVSKPVGRSDNEKVETTSQKGSFNSSHPKDCSKGISNPSGTHTHDC
jgi:hypothetical protein